MGGSTGTISKVFTPTTVAGEQNKTLIQNQGAGDAVGSAVHLAYGIVNNFDGENLRVKAYEATSGTPLANDNWIPLLGTQRSFEESPYSDDLLGWKVLVTFTGPSGGNATAQLNGEPDEIPGFIKRTPRKAKQNAYRIFSPGIGIG